MGKKFMKLMAMVLSFVMIFSLCLAPMNASAAENQPLKFDENGKFKIVIFSDVQDQYPVHQRVLRIMEQAIERENPDLVVFTGDMTEINTKDVNVDYRRTVQQILAPVVEAGVPYSIVFGNHDNQSATSGTVLDRDQMLAVWQSIGDCRTVDDVPALSGAGNCKISIESSTSTATAFNLWMLDSGSYQNPLDGRSGYGSVNADQLEWMAANNDAGVNSIAFQHIPMPETVNLFVEDENGTESYNNKTYKVELIDGVVGAAGEFPHPCPPANAGEYAALKAMGNVLGVVTGHDHLNDFTGKFEEGGVEMTAVPGMTYFNYGKEEIRGYGVIELDEADLTKYSYHSVKNTTLDAEAGGTTETVYDSYDVITYADLRDTNGNALSDEYTISGGHNFTYNATSPSYSAVFKFRWTAGSKPGFQVSFDGDPDGGNITAPFGLWIKRPNQYENTGPNGSWHLIPSQHDLEVNMTSPALKGNTYDIEFGRKKVLSGDPKYIGMYYLYLKVDGKLIQEGYTNTDENGDYYYDGKDRSLNNIIRFGGWGNGGDDVISAFVEPPEQYAPYDVIGYEDLLDTGNNPLTPGGIQLTKTNNSVSYVESAEAALTHSVIFKLRWTMETLAKFEIHMKGWGGQNNFAYFLGNNHWQHKANNPGPAVALNPAPTAGDYYDLEVARLMVTSGENEGKYYTYFKVDGEMIFEKYVAADDENTTKYLGNTIFLGFADNETCKISATPYDANPDSLYYDYDEVTYYDMLIDGNKISGDVLPINNYSFTYDKTAETGSAIIKYRWKEANAGSNFQLGFDTVGEFAYLFGVQYYTPTEEFPNGNIWLRPGYGPKAELPEALVTGQDYDIEFARLKVKNGEHAGDWHVYFKINNVLVAEDYVDGSLVSKQGNYTSNPSSKAHTISNNFYLTFWGNGGGNKIAPSPYEEAYENYDDLSYNDLFIGDVSMNGQTMNNGNKEYTYKATSSSYSTKFNFRWTAGATKPGFTLYFDDWKFPFCFCAKYPNRADFGAAAGENGAWHLVPSNNGNIVQMTKPAAEGDTYDIEVGRLKVKNGANKGKYYVYAKVDGELIKDYYYDGVVDGAYNGTALSNKIIIASEAGNAFSAIPAEEPEEPEVPEEDEPADALYYAYDEIGYGNLTKSDGSALGSETTLSGANTFKYTSTSATGSVLLKYRWTVGSVPKVQLSFERTKEDTMAYMFGAQLSAPGADAGFDNGRMWLRPGMGPEVNMPEILQAGSVHDVEFARLKVKNGDNAGKYHVYIKIDGKLIAEDYVAADVVDEDGYYTSNPGSTECNVHSGQVFMVHWGSNGNKISATPVPETYEAYDNLTYDDLFVGDISMSGQTMTSNQEYHYNATSPSYSAILKYRWIPGGNSMKFTTFFDDWVYPFCFAAKTPNQTGFGAAAGENGAWHLVPSNDSFIKQMDEPVVAGQPYDIEVARLKVATGTNAGKYYVYAKVNGELIQSYYYDGVVDGVYGSSNTKLSNKIIIAIPEGNKVTATPFVEEYEDYDVIGFEDLRDADGNGLGTTKPMSGATVLNYDRTSATGSVVFKYRWKIGSVAKFQMSFEKAAADAMGYMFGAWLYAPGEDNSTNGQLWLRPSFGPKVQLSEALVPGSSHNVEFARLKVKNGPNAGKYYVYFKLDDVLIAEDYVAANVVDADGNYVTGPGDVTCNVKSGEIFMAFWGSENNVISAYKELGAGTFEGVTGDFDDDGVINATDLAMLKRVLLGLEEEISPEMADYNKDGKVNIIDLIAMKKDLIPNNTYAKTGDLSVGIQEHLNEGVIKDESKSIEYIADASAALGVNSYRLSTPIHNLYYTTSTNGVAVREEAMAEFKAMVAALKAKGIDEILYVTDSFLLPYGYSDPEKNHNITVPDPTTDTENYIAWLTVNAAGFKALAQDVPEIDYFEPFNEINTTGTRFEKYGIGWNATEEEKLAHKFTVTEKAAIMADLCWYISRAVKSVDTANQVTTPSIATGSNSVIEANFAEEFYKAIQSGTHPVNKTFADKRVDNYFTILNVHGYPDYTEDDSWLGNNFESNAAKEIQEWADYLTAVYNVAKDYGDGDSRVWITETGMSTCHSDGVFRNEDNVARLIELALEKADNDLTFIDNVILYKIADVSTENGWSPSETYFGLFYSFDDLDHDPYAAKPSAKAVYRFIHDGSTDYSALDALVDKYAE